MGVVLLYSAHTVGVVCRRVALHDEDNIRVEKDVDYEPLDSDVIVRWDSAAPIFGGTQLQTAKAIKLSRNKSKARAALGDLAPKTWFEIEDVELPAVVRPRRHHAGKKFFIATTPAQLRKAITACGLDWYASPVLVKDREYRVYVLQGHVTSVSKRTCSDPNQVAWNVALGASMAKIKRVNWPLDIVKVAVKAAERLGLKFAAVDVAITTSGEIVVFEANTAPGLVANAKSLPLLAKALAYAGNHLDLEPAPEGARSWKSLLHPGLKA